MQSDLGAHLGVGIVSSSRSSQPGPDISAPTTLILIRHGQTDHTSQMLFSSGLGGANPGLNDHGRDQVTQTATWLAGLADQIDVLVTSPVKRAEETAAILGHALELEPTIEHDLAEMDFGTWDGLSFAEVAEREPEALRTWMGSLTVTPGGGESFRDVEARVLRARDRLVTEHRGKTVMVVSHVTPIKTLVAHSVDAPLTSLFRMELTPASVSVISHYERGPDGNPASSLRLYNARPGDDVVLSRHHH